MCSSSLSGRARDNGLPSQVRRFPQTRFMGSKQKLLGHIARELSRFEFESAIDLFSGTGSVGYLLKAMGKSVVCNDYMAMSAQFAKAMIENSRVRLPLDDARALVRKSASSDGFVAKTFSGLYFSDEDNRLIDSLRANIAELEDACEKSIAMSALIRACMKKRARGIFTYTGFRYDDGRRDLSLSLEEHFLKAVEDINAAVFDNGRACRSVWGDALELKDRADVVYIDPPYYSPYSDNEYVRRYHFVEGLARNWEGVEIQQSTKTKKFKSYPTPFSTKSGAFNAFQTLFELHRESVIVISYSSNSEPTQDEMVALLKRFKRTVTVVPVDYRYSFGTQRSLSRNAVKELLFIGS